ncbi:MAG TPA: transglycosylase SLT domain-containing protein, partial [Dehalococcoidia bacterium]|nr:transglycosylase SLT domain-containing protein [Dehalococcoidia bacterium]
MPPFRLSALATVLPAAVLFVSACGAEDSAPGIQVTPLDETPQAPSQATATQLPGAVLTPQPGLRGDLAAARQLETEGNIELAVDLYVAISASNSPDRSQATLAAARLLLELDRPAEVRLLLEPFVARADLSGSDAAARYLLARAYAALDMWAESLAQYDEYVRSGRPALPYAHLDRSQALIALGRPLEAVAALQSGLALGVPPAMRRSFLSTTAQAYEAAGLMADAIRAYRNLMSESPGDAPFALARIAALKRQAGDPSYTEELRQLLAGYPASPQALEEMNAALGRGEAIDPTLRGLVLYRHNDYAAAEPAFRQQVDAEPNAPASAEAYYFLAAILESRGQNEEAKALYARVPELNPQSTVADDALWWRARLLEDGNRAEAAALYNRLASQYPASPFAADAAFRQGVIDYRAGNYASAAALWEQNAAAITDPGQRARLTLWRAKALLKGGSQAAAQPLLEQLATEAEDDYPGVRARSLLQGRHGLPHAEVEAKVDLTPAFDWAAAEAWLAQRTGRAISDGAWASDYRWLRAQELWLVGRTAYADAEAFALIESLAQDPIAMYTLSRRLLGEGRIGMSARAGQRLLRVLNTNPNAGLPKALLSLSYPAAFGPLVERYAKEQRISPLLLLAFVRQESFFDPRAVSPAGAMGLTQVLPKTGETIARELDIDDYTPDRLLHADFNLRLGAKYMADQLKRFGNEIFVALAAYNAGPSAASRWRSASGSDGDLFLETV